MDYWERKIVKMYRIVFLLLISATVWACSEKKEETMPLPFYNEPTFTPMFLEKEAEIDQKITHRIGDFSFLNQDSVKIDQTIVEGKIHVANFIFTICGSICPTMTNNMKTVSDSLRGADGVVLLSYSVTPWIDTPAVLKKFKENYAIENDNWHFITGSQSAIYTLARQSYFAEEDIGFSRDSSEFLHTEHFILVDQSKRIRGVYNGTLALEMGQLVVDIKSLQDPE